MCELHQWNSRMKNYICCMIMYILKIDLYVVEMQGARVPFI